MNICDDRSQKAADIWYIQASRNCFLNLERNNFLLLFLLPICLPYNKNYARTTRTPGRASGTQKKSPGVIARQQAELLRRYRQELLLPWENPQGDVVGRARALADRIKMSGIIKVIDEDCKYIGKGNSCQAGRFLSVFEAGDSAAGMLAQLTELYTLAVRDIFRGLEAYYTNALARKTADILDSFPQACLERELPEGQDRLAWLLAVELVLLACREQDSWQVAGSLGLLCREPEPKVLTAPAKSKVHLPVGVFCRLCTRAAAQVQTVEDAEAMLELLRKYGPDDERMQEPRMKLRERIDILLDELWEQGHRQTGSRSGVMAQISRLEALRGQLGEPASREESRHDFR